MSAAAKVLSTPELLEPILLETNGPQDILTALLVSRFFHATVCLSSALKRKLLVLPNMTLKPQIWKYSPSLAHGPATVRLVNTKEAKNHIDRFFTIRLPNPLLFSIPANTKPTADGLHKLLFQEYQLATLRWSAASLARMGIPTGLIERQTFRLRRLTFKKPIDPTDVPRDSTFRDMFLFREHTTAVLFVCYISDQDGVRIREIRKEKVENEEGVRLQDVIEMVERMEQEGITVKARYRMEVEVDEDIFPTEEEIELVREANHGLQTRSDE